MEVFICLYFTQLVQLTFIFSLLNVLFPLITTPVLLCLKFSAFPCGLHIYCFFFSFISDYSSWFYFFVFLVFLPVFLAWLPSFYPSVKSVASILLCLGWSVHVFSPDAMPPSCFSGTQMTSTSLIIMKQSLLFFFHRIWTFLALWVLLHLDLLTNKNRVIEFGLVSAGPVHKWILVVPND